MSVKIIAFKSIEFPYLTNAQLEEAIACAQREECRAREAQMNVHYRYALLMAWKELLDIQRRRSILAGEKP